MGSNSFFSKMQAMNPLAQILDMPGAHKYAQGQAQDAAGQTDTNGGAYTGINATLAGANAGYRPGGPGATVGFAPTQPTGPNALMGITEKGANLGANLGNTTSPYLDLTSHPGSAFSLSTNNPWVQQSQTQNPYVTAARNSTVTSYGGP
jgi:hypothetical protein